MMQSSSSDWKRSTCLFWVELVLECEGHGSVGYILSSQNFGIYVFFHYFSLCIGKLQVKLPLCDNIFYLLLSILRNAPRCEFSNQIKQ